MSSRRRSGTAAGLAVLLSVTAASCAVAEPSPVPRPTAGTRSAAPIPTSTPTPTATSTPTSTPAAWTAVALTDVCVDFQGSWAEENNYAIDDFEWTSPGTVEQNSGLWYVYLQGTFTTPEGDPVPAEFSCAISGTPDAPVIEESPNE